MVAFYDVPDGVAAIGHRCVTHLCSNKAVERFSNGKCALAPGSNAQAQPYLSSQTIRQYYRIIQPGIYLK